MTHPRHCPFETRQMLNEITLQVQRRAARKTLKVKRSRRFRKSHKSQGENK